jgi:hypothetical protein
MNIFGATPSKEVLGYCDVDWGGDLEDRRSTIGFVFMIGGGAFLGVANDNLQYHCPPRRPNTWRTHKSQKKPYG